MDWRREISIMGYGPISILIIFIIFMGVFKGVKSKLS